MARADHKTSIVPSVLDRLIDDAPNESQEPVSGRFQSIREMERVVARDLEALLNARRETLEELPSEFEEVNRSLLTYGLPDLSSFSLLSENDRNKVRRVIEQTIAAAEPRLGRISVKLEPARAHDRGLRFRIDAQLQIDPAPEPVSFDGQLQLQTQQYIVRGQG